MESGLQGDAATRVDNLARQQEADNAALASQRASQAAKHEERNMMADALGAVNDHLRAIMAERDSARQAHEEVELQCRIAEATGDILSDVYNLDHSHIWSHWCDQWHI